MGPGIVIPLVILPLTIVGGFLAYRRAMASLQPSAPKPLSGRRLTSEALRRLPSPPWRVVYELDGALGSIDHVLIGPSGAIALTTEVLDRPTPDQLMAARGEAHLIGEAALARGPLGELLRASGATCTHSATIFWGAPDGNRRAFDDVVAGYQLVEGQRLNDWAAHLTAAASDPPLEPAAIDAAWRTILLGIGRPDPLG